MNNLISRSEAEKLGATCLARRNENGQLEAIINLDNAPTVDLDESIIQEVLNKRCMTVITNEYLMSLITSNGKRPKGEWKIGGKTTHYHYCSICGKDGDIQDNFCRNCGAKMKGD